MQKIIGYNRNVPWPVSHGNVVGASENIVFHVDDLNNFQHFGCYFQAWGSGRIVIGQGSYIAPNVGLITQNHDVANLDRHDEARDIEIGQNCWVGMNSVILPGVTLGNHTIVGAGSVVTRSSEGHCVLVGVPAREIRKIP